MNTAAKILKDVFGYDTFRPLQEQIIAGVLNKQDCLVVMPTGGGKSLCYQIPALMLEGLTIVISPLISLMKDQVEQLRQLSVHAAVLNSSLSADVYNQNRRDVVDGKAKLLYVAPETLMKDDILYLLRKVNVECITVDEAHCISEWGHDFRPEYRQIGAFRELFPSAACMGLTATATPRVQDDIIKNLQLKGAKKHIASFNRENLFLQVTQKYDSFTQTLAFLDEHKDQPGIIYCFSRKQVDSLYADLANLGYSCRPYHAGLPDEERAANQELFSRDEVRIIIATIAFGMGINKSNVRFVLHHDLPKNIESYYQEIGRSGRDGMRADCLLLFNYADIMKVKYFIDQKEGDEKKAAMRHLDAIVRYAESDTCRRETIIGYFGERYPGGNCGMCDNCLEEQADLADLTVAAQKFLSAVKRTGELFGAKYIVDVLAGAKTQKIVSNNHDSLSVYGIGKEYTKEQWTLLAQQLVQRGIVERDPEYGSIKLLPAASDILFRGGKFLGRLGEQRIAREKIAVQAPVHDAALFELLRLKRKEIASKANVPPYLILSDKALTQMAAEFPLDRAGMLSMSGVGIAKFEKYGAAFLKIITEYCAKHNIKTRVRIRVQEPVRKQEVKPRHREVGELFNAGASLTELSGRFAVQVQTITQHLLRYLLEGNPLRAKGLLEAIHTPAERHAEVFAELSADEETRLGPIFAKFYGQISYEDLHLLRLLYLSGKA